MIRNWLDIIPADNRSITINKPLSFETEVIRIRYGISRRRLMNWKQLYKQTALDTVKAQGFGRQCQETENIRKIHSGHRQ